MPSDAGTEELYLRDPYSREFAARVIRLSGREVVLDRTAFYPGGGGMPSDKGYLGVGPIRTKVIEVRRSGTDDYDGFEGDDLSQKEWIVHVLDRPMPETVREVRGELDWARRHRNLRYATALALFSAVARRDFGLRSGGGRIRSGKARIDLVKSGRGRESGGAAAREIAKKLESAVNETVLSGGRTEVVGGRLKVRDLPPVEGGGLYVRDLAEVGRVEVTRWTDRGRDVRLEFTLPGAGGSR
ncbi:putative metal-dependent hydrolases related to alanyl-tRNA synthetase HxxxH domain [Rubrobacter radiotolerans]|uniref:Alanyl-tRNA editing protein n=1 Tax=Rubrobacter radiotolerans TaxID=42256 RepID=A0A023X5X2_RUBRA|nr:alanyl-tRNA editing protein [Rubrobacter radiotolerans]AHY47400.1 putative metal-dependent hydrolases related to alanyl-tRNA synthetase HxxxH domain [Rubrobacter radiotolerans]MDX5894803.1 alanyl-tRNA editing protein [Rubrobacter radiotolerans]SMC06795.1 alanyl-tRNA synthetase [Rubrobacter radiotolerans DSM 5868]